MTKIMVTNVVVCVHTWTCRSPILSTHAQSITDCVLHTRNVSLIVTYMLKNVRQMGFNRVKKYGNGLMTLWELVKNRNVGNSICGIWKMHNVESVLCSTRLYISHGHQSYQIRGHYSAIAAMLSLVSTGMNY